MPRSQHIDSRRASEQAAPRRADAAAGSPTTKAARRSLNPVGVVLDLLVIGAAVGVCWWLSESWVLCVIIAVQLLAVWWFIWRIVGISPGSWLVSKVFGRGSGSDASPAIDVRQAIEERGFSAAQDAQPWRGPELGFPSTTQPAFTPAARRPAPAAHPVPGVPAAPVTAQPPMPVPAPVSPAVPVPVPPPVPAQPQSPPPTAMPTQSPVPTQFPAPVPLQVPPRPSVPPRPQAPAQPPVPPQPPVAVRPSMPERTPEPQADQPVFGGPHIPEPASPEPVIPEPAMPEPASPIRLDDDQPELDQPELEAARAAAADIEIPSAPTELVLPDGRVESLAGSMLVGRRPRGEHDEHLVTIPDENRSISRSHFAIEVTEFAVLVTDLGSANGTRLRRDGEELLLTADSPVVVLPGDELRIGRFTLRLR